jgi:general stress protein YciG
MSSSEMTGGGSANGSSGGSSEVGASPRKKQRRGFAAMDSAKQKEIASKGGKASHAHGTGHEWNASSAREAGRKGGLASHGGRGKNAGAQ